MNCVTPAALQSSKLSVQRAWQLYGQVFLDFVEYKKKHCYIYIILFIDGEILILKLRIWNCDNFGVRMVLSCKASIVTCIGQSPYTMKLDPVSGFTRRDEHRVISNTEHPADREQGEGRAIPLQRFGMQLIMIWAKV